MLEVQVEVCHTIWDSGLADSGLADSGLAETCLKGCFLVSLPGDQNETVIDSLPDPNSHMDLMRINGLDYSKAGRARYAAEHGIGGDPFSASWGEAMLQDVRRRYGKGPRG